MTRTTEMPLEERIPDPRIRSITERRINGVDRLIALQKFPNRRAIAEEIGTSPSNLATILRKGVVNSAPALRLDALISRELPDAARELPIGYNQSHEAAVFAPLREQLGAAERVTYDNSSINRRVAILRKRFEAMLVELDVIEEMEKEST